MQRWNRYALVLAACASLALVFAAPRQTLTANPGSPASFPSSVTAFAVDSADAVPDSTLGQAASLPTSTSVMLTDDTLHVVPTVYRTLATVDGNAHGAANPPSHPAPASTESRHTYSAGWATQLASRSAGAVPGSLAVNSTDLYWLARIIHAEADGESLEAQIAVGDVVVHRVTSPYYPHTVKGVIFQVVDGHYQFTPVANGHIYTTPTKKNIQAAQAVLLRHVDLVPGAYVFYNSAKTPAASWVRTRPVLYHVGDFTFAR